MTINLNGHGTSGPVSGTPELLNLQGKFFRLLSYVIGTVQSVAARLKSIPLRTDGIGPQWSLEPSIIAPTAIKYRT
jgi:hypothetical protein